MNSKSIIGIVLAVLFALPGGVGLYFFEMIVQDWVQSGFIVTGAFAAFGSIILLVSVTSMTVSVLLLGLLLRRFQTDWSRNVSLGLCIIYAFLLSVLTFMMRTYDFVLLDVISFGPLVLFVLVVPGLVIGVLPTFLYWFRGRQN